MNRRGVLILSHQGYSFLEALVKVVTRSGYDCFVLSSQPVTDAEQRIMAITGMVPWCRVTQERNLTEKDVLDAIEELRGEGANIVCCLSVWEGYRPFMAKANQVLGIADISPEQVRLMQDKLAFRRKVGELGLSHITVMHCDNTALAALKRDNAPVFIKPRLGISSYGTFRLAPETPADILDRLAAEMRNDAVCRYYLGDKPEFIAETLIEGPEFSFEIVFSANGPVIFVHEKIEIEEAPGAVLENACTAPSLSLTVSQEKAARDWVLHVFERLGIRHGCFHLEAKLTAQGRWEIIEINPRVGGAYISRSVELQTDGVSLLDMWVDSLVPEGHIKPIPRNCHRGTFFRVYFAEPGRKVVDIQMDHSVPPPVDSQILIRPGITTDDSTKEIFLAQAIWTTELGPAREKEVQALLRQSKKLFEVRYE